MATTFRSPSTGSATASCSRSRDSRGRIIAFGGRALSSDALAKYLNSPETELFHKGNVLYNFVRARKAMQKDGTVIAVEGYMDVIALAQAGFENVVAPLGTALTENQLELIWRMAGEPVLCFDGDQAGLKAAWRAADMALPLIQPGRTLRFALLPEGKDPDDLVKADGPDAFRAVLAEARPLADLLWMRETSGGVFDTPERRADLEKTLRELTGRIRDESVRYHYQQEMRDRVHAFFGAQRARPVDKPGRAAGKRDSGRAGRPMGARWRGGGPPRRLRKPGPLGAGQARRQRHAAARGGDRGGAGQPSATGRREFRPDRNASIFAIPNCGALHSALIDAHAHGQAGDRVATVEAIRNAGLGDAWERAVGLIRRARMWPALEDAGLDDARDAFAQALHLQRSAGTLHKELKAAEAALATDPTEENYRHFVEIQAQFRDVQAPEALIEGFGVSSGRATRSF